MEDGSVTTARVRSAVALAAVLILVTTLWPLDLQPVDICQICLSPCGVTPLSDGVRNILLFTPLGYVLRRTGLFARAAVASAPAPSSERCMMRTTKHPSGLAGWTKGRSR